MQAAVMTQLAATFTDFPPGQAPLDFDPQHVAARDRDDGASRGNLGFFVRLWRSGCTDRAACISASVQGVCSVRQLCGLLGCTPNF
jgi:hypothetical protein